MHHVCANMWCKSGSDKCGCSTCHLLSSSIYQHLDTFFMDDSYCVVNLVSAFRCAPSRHHWFSEYMLLSV